MDQPTRYKRFANATHLREHCKKSLILINPCLNDKKLCHVQKYPLNTDAFPNEKLLANSPVITGYFVVLLSEIGPFFSALFQFFEVLKLLAKTSWVTLTSKQWGAPTSFLGDKSHLKSNVFNKECFRNHWVVAGCSVRQWAHLDKNEITKRKIVEPLWKKSIHSYIFRPCETNEGFNADFNWIQHVWKLINCSEMFLVFSLVNYTWWKKTFFVSYVLFTLTEI